MPPDPGAAKLIALSRASGRPPVEQLTPAAARKAIREAAPMISGPRADMAAVDTLEISGPGTALALRLYRPLPRTPDTADPAMLFLHGGGWVVGDLDTHDALARALAKASGCVVASLDYRLAPEHPFPAALDDATAALAWLVQDAARLGIDPGRIGVAGDSAGGNLAAVLAITARDGDAPPVAFQLLLYPVCDLSMSQASYERNGTDFLLTRDSMAYFIAAYAGGRDIAGDWRASPLAAADLSGVAPAIVLTTGNDPLCDEGFAYANRLEDAGVPTRHLHLPGQIHGFLTAAAIVTEAAGVIEQVGRHLRDYVAPGCRRTSGTG